MPRSTLTVVYEFNNDKALELKAQEVNELFLKDDGADIRVTASSSQDEMSKLDMIEFGVEVDDLEFVRGVISESNLKESFTIMMSAREYAEKNGVTDYAGYEAIQG
jgi:hypothetical protein